MKSVLSISLLALSSLWAVSQEVSVDALKTSAKMIPVVDYTPADFEAAITNSFNFDSHKLCFFIKNADKKAPEIYMYKGTKTQSAGRLDIELPLSATQKETLLTADSVFILIPMRSSVGEFIPQHIEYIGFRKSGQTHYMTADKTFGNLYDFVVSEFGSAGNFTALYLESMRRAFLCPGSGLYGFDSDRAALDFLKHDYRFNAVCNRQAEETIPLFIELLKKAVIVSPAQEARLTKLLADSYKTGDQITSDFLSGKSFEVFRPQTLRAVFSPDEYDLIQNAITENKARLAIAYWRISKTIGNTDANGAYLSDRDILKEISKRTF